MIVYSLLMSVAPGFVWAAGEPSLAIGRRIAELHDDRDLRATPEEDELVVPVLDLVGLIEVGVAHELAEARFGLLMSGGGMHSPTIPRSRLHGCSGLCQHWP
jgi:hypothetical protein